MESEVDIILGMEELPAASEPKGATPLPSLDKPKIKEVAPRATRREIRPVVERTALIMFVPLPNGEFPSYSDPEVVRRVYPQRIADAKAKGEEELRREMQRSSRTIKTYTGQISGRFKRAERYPETVKASEQALLDKFRVLLGVPTLTFGQVPTLRRRETTIENLRAGDCAGTAEMVVFPAPKPTVPPKSHHPTTDFKFVDGIRRVRPGAAPAFELMVSRRR